MYFECYHLFSLISTASDPQVKYAEAGVLCAITAKIDCNRVIGFKSI